MKPLLRGEPLHRCVPVLFAGTQRASGVGGTRPPRLSPGGGNGKGGDQTSLLPQAVRVRTSGTPLGYCVLALVPCFSSFQSTNRYVDPLVPLSRSLAGATQLLCRASIRTLNGPQWARCMLGSDLKPRSITTVTDLGCWVLLSWRRSLLRISGVYAVTRTRQWMSLLTKLLEAGLRAINSCWLCFLLWLPECGCSEWLSLGGLLLDLGRLGYFRGRRALA